MRVLVYYIRYDVVLLTFVMKYIYIYLKPYDKILLVILGIVA